MNNATLLQFSLIFQLIKDINNESVLTCNESWTEFRDLQNLHHFEKSWRNKDNMLPPYTF